MLYAHYNKNTKETQELIIHLQNIADSMVPSKEYINFQGISNEELSQMMKETGFLHDIGKAMRSFQRYLLTGIGGDEKNHSLISSAIFSMKYDFKNILAFISASSIAMHHNNLFKSNTMFNQTGELWSQLKKQYIECKDSLEKEKILTEYVKISSLDIEKVGKFFRVGKNYLEHKNDDMWFFVQQYIFSKLISADKIDSAYIKLNNNNKNYLLEDVTRYLKKKNKDKITTLDDDRNKIKESVLFMINSLSDEEIKNKRIFTLTAPTGTGKTLTSISAAIRLYERIKSALGYSPNIITAMPFINILEQTIEDYEGIFGEILVHYGACEHEFKKDDNIPLKDKLLLTNAWENSVIVTTFVQLFESIFTSSNARLLKLNKMCGSIVILDEIQAINEKYYPLIGILIDRMSKYYGTRFILMTATRPEILNSANNLVDNINISSIELLRDNQQYFRKLKRTRIIPVFDKIQNKENLIEFICNTKKEHQSALVVLNRIKDSIEIYKTLSEIYGKDNVLCLSTNLVGIHRKEIIENAKKRIKNKIPFILVSTQSVEAGVNLSFDLGFRDLAPLPSIIQVAGRINRSGEKGEFCPVYIFDLETHKNIYNQYTVKLTKNSLNKEIDENEYEELISNYYKTLKENMDFDKEVYNGMLKLEYSKIDNFKLIEEKDRHAVIIECDENISKILQDYNATLVKIKNFKNMDIDKFELKSQLKKILQKIGLYTVEVYGKRLESNKPIKCIDIGIELDYYIVPKEELERYYDFKTGFIDENKDPY